MERELFLCIMGISLCAYPVCAEDMGSLSSGATSSGAIAAAGEQDTWTFTAAAGDHIVFSVAETSGSFSPAVALYEPGGSLEISGDRFISYPVSQTGTYRVVVQDASLSGTGTYNITFLNFRECSGTISSNETHSGTISAASDMDIWQFSATASDHVLLNILATSGALRTIFIVFAPNGDVESSYLRDWHVSQTGTYTVVIYDGEDPESDPSDTVLDDTGGYNITFLNLDEGSWPTISSNQTRSGSIDAVTDAEVWQFSAVIYERIKLAVIPTSGELHPDMTIYAPDGSREAHDDLYINRHVSQTGTYTVVINDGDTGADDVNYDRTGAYNITFVNLDDCSASAISCGETRSGAIDAASEIDVWQFSASEGEHISIRVLETSGSLYPYVTMYAPDHMGEKAGYRFVDWIGPRTGTYTVVVCDGQAFANDTVMDDAGGYDITVTCGSGVSNYTLNVSSTTGGSVTAPGEGAYTYTPGSTVPVAAAAEAGYEFTGWSGTAVLAGKVANKDSLSTTVKMDGDYTLIANFGATGPGPQHSLTISATAGGHVSTPGEGTYSYSEGTHVSIQAAPDNGYRFVLWTGTAASAGKVANPTSSATTVTMDGDYTLRAEFEPIGSTVQHTLTLSSTSGGYVATPGEGAFAYDEGTLVSIVAQANSGCRFVRWTGTAVDAGRVANPTARSTTVTMAADYTLVAQFETVEPATWCSLTVTSTAGGYVSAPGEGSFTYDNGSEILITAQADAGYQFSAWTGTAVDAGRVVDPAAANTAVALDADYSLCANFIADGPSSVLVLAPNGGESLTAGSMGSIRWQVQGPIAYIAVDLSVDGGSAWTQVFQQSGPSGSCDWAVPSVNSDRCLIRIRATQNPGISDTSDAPFSIHSAARRVWYVDAAATGSGNGQNWANAFVCLQDALAQAGVGDDVWVAQGRYWPDLGGRQTAGDRAATFQLKNGLAICGGFPSGGGDWLQRNPVLHPTILSGDIGANGVATDNSYHVVTGHGTNDTAILDGCTICDGFANGAEPQDRGAGLYNLRGNPRVRNCIFIGNTALSGNGGGACNIESGVTFINCVFSGNTAGNCGGGLYSEQGAVTVLNCTFVANQGLWRGGGVFNAAGTMTVTNCILWGNGRMNRMSYDELAQLSGDPKPIVNYCCVQGWTGSLGGQNSFGRDPLFLDTDGADNVVGTPDDDLRLQAGSPCIDKGDNAAVPPEVATDQQGDPRIISNAVDIGAYEFGEMPAPSETGAP